jgi:hypothetical protein
MKRPRLTLFALFFAGLCASAVHAQVTQKPEEPQQPDTKPAAEAQKPRPVPGQAADPKILEKIFACLANGLPRGWKKTWFVINEIDRNEAGTSRNYEADFFFATNVKDTKGRKLTPCGADPVLEGVAALNDYLQEGQQRWTGATFTFTSEGKFDATYDYTPRKPAPAKPAVKPAAKKTDSSSKQQ